MKCIQEFDFTVIYGNKLMSRFQGYSMNLQKNLGYVSFIITFFYEK